MDVGRRAVLRAWAIAGSLTMGAGAPAIGDEIYKSVDRAGHVTYADAPSAGAVTTEALALPDEPTADEVLAAEEQHRLIQSIGTTLEQERKQREQERARREAEERAQQAASALTIVYVPLPVYSEPIYVPPPAVRPPPCAHPPVLSILPGARPKQAKTDP